MEILHQLGELFLQAAPTVILVLLFYFFLSWAFFKPVQKAMADRSGLIEGARAEAAAAELEAKAELDTYSEAIRKARGQIYAEQEAARQAVLAERGRLIQAVRNRAQDEVAAAKAKIAEDLKSARAELEQQTPALASDIARAILQNRPAPGGVTR